MPRWIAALLVLALPVSAQNTQPAEPDDSGLVLRFDVNLVQIDAVVTDSAGQHVADLTAEDFEIRQDGKRQQITHFSYIPEEPPADNQLRSRVEPRSQLERDEVRRTIAILVDDFRMEFGDFVRTRRALSRFIEEELRPGDMLSVLRTATGSGALQQFSADREYLEHVVDRLQWMPPSGSDVPLLHVLPQVLQAMSEFPGRKTLVVISPGLVTSAANVNWLMDTASRSSTVIHTVDVAGVRTYDLTASDVRRGSRNDYAAEYRTPNLFLGSSIPWSGGYRDRRAILDSLADNTGGLFFRGSNDLNRQVVDAARDFSGYYLIGWDPGSEAFKRRAGWPITSHRLRVRVNRKGLSVRTRSGYEAIEGPPPRPASLSDAAWMRSALFSPFKSGDIDVRLSASFQHDSASGAYVQSLLHILPEGIEFEQGEGDCRFADLELLSTSLWLDQSALVPTGTSSAQHAHMEVCGESVPRMLADGFAVELRSPVERPGGYQMRVAVRNIEPGEPFSNAPADSTQSESDFTERPPRIGSAVQVVGVPDWNEDRLSVTGLSVGEPNRPLPDEGGASFRALLAEADPALRTFHAGDEVSYRFRVVSARENRPLIARMMLVEDDRLVATAEPVPVTKGEPVQGVFRLDESVEPGRYLFGVEVTESDDRRNPEVVQQWIDLEVPE